MAVNPLVIGAGADDYPESEPLGRLIEVSDPKVTGVISGGILSRVSATTFTYTAGSGVTHDPAASGNSYPRTWPAAPAPITRDPATPNAIIQVSLQWPGPVLKQRLIQNWTAQMFRSETLLGRLLLDDSGEIPADGVRPQPVPANGFPFAFLDYLGVIGYSSIESGLLLAANGANVRLDLTEGVVFSPGVNLHSDPANPNRLDVAEWKPLKFTSILADGAVVGSAIQDVDTAQYDAGLGLLQPIPAGRAVAHVLYAGSDERVYLQYGQIHRPSVSSLLTQLGDIMRLFLYAPQFGRYGISLGAVLFVQGETDFSVFPRTVILDRTWFGATGLLDGVPRTVDSVSAVFPDEFGNVPLDVLQDPADQTKFLRLSLAALTTATERIQAAQDVDGTLPVQIDATLTQGSVPFAAADGRLAQANPGMIFDGTSILTLGNSANTRLDMFSDGDNTGNIDIDMNRTTADVNLGGLRFLWNNTQVVQFVGRTGPTTATKNDGVAAIRTATAGSTPTDRLVIDNTGKVTYPGVGSAPVLIEADANATAAGDPLLVWTGKWNGNPVVEMRFEGGVNDTAKDEGRVRFRVKNNNIFVNSITMKHNGFVAIGRNVTDPQGELHVEGTSTVATIVFATPTQRYDMRVNTATGDWNLTDYTAGSLTPLRVKLGAATNTFVIEDARIGVNTNTPDPTTALDVVSTTGGIAPPEMTTAQRDSISSPKRQIISNITVDKLQYYTGSAWVDLH